MPPLHDRLSGFRVSLILLLVLLAAVAAALAYAWQPAIPPAHPNRTGFTHAAIAHGAQLAALGDCDTCHTRTRHFAGGVPVQTPFGTIFSNNITPDPATGIGTWSEAAFEHAMWRGSIALATIATRQRRPADPERGTAQSASGPAA